MSDTNAASRVDADYAFLRSLGWPSPSDIKTVLASLHPDSLPATPPERQRWLLCALLQHTADTHRLDALAWGNDERLDAYLDAIADGNLPTDLLELSHWLKYLPANRAQKHARRHRLLVRRRYDLRRPELPRPEAAHELTDDLARLRSRTTPREWHLLLCVATNGLKAVAACEGLALGTLKSLLSRCRARLRLAS